MTRTHMWREEPVQLDLFGEIEAEEARCAAERAVAHRQAVEFLTSPWPDLLAWWIDPDGSTIERRLDHGATKASYRRGRIGEPDWPGWAWSKWRDGLHFERGDEWSAAGGWRHRPRHVLPWAALHQLRDAHPTELAELHQLSAGRGTPFSLGWKWYACPEILRPWGTNPSHFEQERSDSYYDSQYLDPQPPPNAFADRMRAWTIVIGLTNQFCLEMLP